MDPGDFLAKHTVKRLRGPEEERKVRLKKQKYEDLAPNSETEVVMGGSHKSFCRIRFRSGDARVQKRGKLGIVVASALTLPTLSLTYDIVITTDDPEAPCDVPTPDTFPKRHHVFLIPTRSNNEYPLSLEEATDCENAPLSNYGSKGQFYRALKSLYNARTLPSRVKVYKTHAHNTMGAQTKVLVKVMHIEWNDVVTYYKTQYKLAAMKNPRTHPYHWARTQLSWLTKEQQTKKSELNDAEKSLDLETVINTLSKACSTHSDLTEQLLTVVDTLSHHVLIANK